jgi:hypothetical protein
VGRTPSSAPDPWSGFLLQRKADEGVGRGPGGPPYFNSAAILSGSFGTTIG